MGKFKISNDFILLLMALGVFVVMLLVKVFLVD